MNIVSNEEAFDMISLLKSNFRSVRRTTNNLKDDDSLSYQEKYKKLEIIEQECIENTLNSPKMNKEFIIGIYDLLISYQNGTAGREEAYRNYLYKYVSGNIEKLIGFINTNLFAEYEYAINHPKHIINLYLDNE